MEYEDGSPPTTEVIPTAALRARVEREVGTGGVRALCVGHATTSDEVVRMCAAGWPEIPLHVVDETNSTLQARSLYYQDHPPRGWLRFVPRGLLVPDAPLDGYAALIIVRRYRAFAASQGRSTTTH